MKLKRCDTANQALIGTFLCTQLPSEIPAWITIVDRVAEPGYWRQFDWQDQHIQILLAHSIEFIITLPAYLSFLGFEGVETVEWEMLIRFGES
jgi:hypothetical protein